MDPQWLNWAKRLQAISQNGLLFAVNPYDVERYSAIREIALEIISEGSGADINLLREVFVQEEGNATPKVDVRGIVSKDGAILFVKEEDDHLWSLPGGWCEPGLSPSEVVKKEIVEEAGFEIKVTKLLGVYDQSQYLDLPHSPYHVYTICFLCEIMGSKVASGLETIDIRFFRENEVPELSPGRVSSSLVFRMFDHVKHPEWSADFD